MNEWQTSLMYLGIAGILVFINGFFVAAEFALVKVRGSQLDELVKQKRPFAKTARWLGDRLDGSLSACQLGITLASLALGWVGEPAFASLLEPLFHLVNITSPAARHTAGFICAFTVITTLHLVIGEQAPKIYAIRKPEVMVLWCAVPLKFFYILCYPFLVALSYSTAKLLSLVGIEGASEHDTPHTEAELRALIEQSHGHGELTLSEERLIHAVFEFDDMVCRRIMVPRSDVAYFDVDFSFEECLEAVNDLKHTRFPLCDESMDNVIGIIHIKDFVGIDGDSKIDLREIARKANFVSETMPISQLLKHFQKTHQLMALVVDEHGTTIGIVTLENVLEQIIGPVEDEFDNETPVIKQTGEGQFTVLGSAPLDIINRKFDLQLDAAGVDTMAGIMLERAGRLLKVGDKLQFDDMVAEVIEIDRTRAKLIRLTFPKKEIEPLSHP